MTGAAIRIEGLWKEYAIGGRVRPRMTFREALLDAAMAPLRQLLRPGSGPEADNRFWALQNINLEIAPGEVVGIIGRNGAGKSTLLKILSRITAPTRGRVEIAGRLSSLLEVGTGFHTELTGRENVYLNGAILGMSRAEIRRKFDAIVDFSGVEKFIDTPVKHYSSGMQVRLAFAVAAHLDPEILIVDEVLAVGDAEFQRKCLGKMGEVAAGGRTVLFVSHNIAAVRQLCDRGVILEAGALQLDATAAEAVDRYLTAVVSEGSSSFRPKPGDKDVTLISASILGSAGRETSRFAYEDDIVVQLEYRVAKPIRNMEVVVRLIAADGTIVLSTGDLESGGRDVTERGTYISRCRLPARLLNTGTYFVMLAAHVLRVQLYFLYDAALSFSVHSAPNDAYPGIAHVQAEWSAESVVA